MSVRIVNCVNFINESIDSKEEFMEEIERRRFCSIDVLFLEEDGVSAKVYHNPQSGFISDEFLRCKAVMYNQTWCVARHYDWFENIEDLAKVSSIPIPCSKKIEIAILALI